jgi:hypothetical protein
MFERLLGWFRKEPKPTPAEIPVRSWYDTAVLYDYETEVAHMRVHYEDAVKQGGYNNLPVVMTGILLLAEDMQRVMRLCESSPMHAQGFLSKAANPAFDRETYHIGVTEPMLLVAKRKEREGDLAEAQRAERLVASLDRINAIYCQAFHSVPDHALPSEQQESFEAVMVDVIHRHIQDVILRLHGVLVHMEEILASEDKKQSESL